MQPNESEPNLLSALGDHDLATEVARRAGSLLLEIRGGLDGSQSAAEVRQEGDLRSHDLIASLLARARPGDALLSEEDSGDSITRLRVSRVWIVDPLDGTLEFGEFGRNDWAVHVALAQEGCLVAGAVAIPAAGLIFSTSLTQLVRPPARRLKVAVSRSRPPREARAIADRLGAELCPMGSAGVKAMAVVTGEVDAYVHSGGQYEWDSAAPVAVATAAGLHVSRLDGSELAYNQPSPWLPDLVICRPELRESIFEAVA